MTSTPLLSIFGRYINPWKWLAIGLMINGITGCQPAARRESPKPNPVFQEVETYFSALARMSQFNGVVRVEVPGDQPYLKAFNGNAAPGSTLWVDESTCFDIHSISKLMAHYLLLKMEAEGKLKLSQPLSDFFPDFPRGNEITLEMLVQHRSGLPRELANPPHNLVEQSAASYLEMIKQAPLLFEPGSAEQYSNLGYELVYAVIAKVMERPFAQCLQDSVFGPMGMEHSGAHFHVQPPRQLPLAKNHTLEDDSLVVVPNILPEEFSTARIFSNAEDLDRFLQVVGDSPFASRLANDQGVIGKSGGSSGIRAQIYLKQSENYRYVLLCNTDAIPFQQTVADVERILAGETVAIPAPLNRASVAVNVPQLEPFLGTYAFADLGGQSITLGIHEGKLAILEEGESPVVLFAESDSVFFEDAHSPESFEFVQDGKGGIKLLMGFQGVKLPGIRK